MKKLRHFQIVVATAVLASAALPASAQAPATCECPSIVSSGDVAMTGSLSLSSSRQLSSCVSEVDATGRLDCNVRSSCSAPGSPPERCAADVSMTITTVTVACPDGSSKSSQMCHGTVKFFNTPKGFSLSSCDLTGQIESNGKLTFSLSSFTHTVQSPRDAASGQATGRMAASPTGVTLTASCSYIGHVTIVK
jgi:hypothetical protein